MVGIPDNEEGRTPGIGVCVDDCGCVVNVAAKVDDVLEDVKSGEEAAAACAAATGFGNDDEGVRSEAEFVEMTTLRLLKLMMWFFL